MTKLQQYTFVCAPQPVQWAGAVAHGRADGRRIVADYRRKRDLIVDGLADKYEVAKPGGAFTSFPKPPGQRQRVRRRGDREQRPDHPRQLFSRRDTHFRISYAASDDTIHRGIEVLRKLA